MFLTCTAPLGQNIDKQKKNQTNFGLNPSIVKSIWSHLVTRKYWVCRQMHPAVPVLSGKLPINIHKIHPNQRKRKVKRLIMDKV